MFQYSVTHCLYYKKSPLTSVTPEVIDSFICFRAGITLASGSGFIVTDLWDILAFSNWLLIFGKQLDTFQIVIFTVSLVSSLLIQNP